MTEERALAELGSLYPNLSEEKKQAIDVAEDAIREKIKERWIPISEKEPNTDDHVLVTFKHEDGSYDVSEMDYAVTKWTAEKDPDIKNREAAKYWLGMVIAWRPKPEAYKES